MRIEQRHVTKLQIGDVIYACDNVFGVVHLQVLKTWSDTTNFSFITTNSDVIHVYENNTLTYVAVLVR